jgi:hypothetical protein
MPKAKKRSADPAQQALRDHKSEWKDAQKEFVAHVMGLKNGLNGRGDSRFGIPPSNIKDPLPGEISALLGALTSQFQTLVGGAGSIMAEQNAYSQHRRKKQEKKPQLPKQPKPGIPEAKPEQNQPAENAPEKNTAVDSFLSNVAMSKSDFLEKYSSSAPSRAIQYLKPLNPWNKEKDLKRRIGLLRSAAEMYDNFLDLENSILSFDIESIPESIYELQSIHANLQVFKSSISEEASDTSEKPVGAPNKPKGNELLHDMLNNPGPDQSSPSSPVSSRRQELEKQLPDPKEIKATVKVINYDTGVIHSSSLPLKSECLKLLSIVKEFGAALRGKNIALAVELYDKMIEDHNTLKMALSTLINNEKNDVKKNQLEEILKRSEFSSDEIIKLSHNFVTRFLKKKWIGLRGSNKTAIHRLKISDSIESIKKILQKMMNSLEKKIDDDLLNESIKNIESESKKIQDRLGVLNIIYRQHAFKEYSKRRKEKQPNTNPFMDSVLQNEFRRDMKRRIL